MWELVDRISKVGARADYEAPRNEQAVEKSLHWVRNQSSSSVEEDRIRLVRLEGNGSYDCEKNTPEPSKPTRKSARVKRRKIALRSANQGVVETEVASPASVSVQEYEALAPSIQPSIQEEPENAPRGAYFVSNFIPEAWWNWMREHRQVLLAAGAGFLLGMLAVEWFGSDPELPVDPAIVDETPKVSTSDTPRALEPSVEAAKEPTPSWAWWGLYQGEPSPGALYRPPSSYDDLYRSEYETGQDHNRPQYREYPGAGNGSPAYQYRPNLSRRSPNFDPWQAPSDSAGYGMVDRYPGRAESRTRRPWGEVGAYRSSRGSQEAYSAYQEPPIRNFRQSYPEPIRGGYGSGGYGGYPGAGLDPYSSDWSSGYW